jgi:uncharacterized protein involved in outer membrane biogenesis
MRKKLLIVLAVLGVVVVFLAARDWDSPELGKALLDKVSAATGMEIKAEGFRLNLIKGVVLEKVEAKSESEGRDLTFHLDRLVFEHRLLPLLSGTVAVDRILLEKPRFELVQTQAKAAASKKTKEPAKPPSSEGGEAPEGSGLALEVNRIQIEDGSLGTCD